MTDPSKESQVKKILAWLMSGRDLTSLDALRLFGCFRLAARIKDLEKSGHVISRQMVYVGDKKVMNYWMSRETIV
jgi:hypothetical protein